MKSKRPILESNIQLASKVPGKERRIVDVNEFTIRSENLKSRLYRTAFLYLGSENMAVEAVGEAVYRGFKSYRSLRDPAFFETWLTRILINVCKKELRLRKRELMFDELPETAAEAFDALPLKDAVLRLPRSLKDVVILRYFSGFTLAQTARSLDIPQGTVATRQRNALKLLRLELSEEA